MSKEKEGGVKILGKIKRIS